MTKLLRSALLVAVGLFGAAGPAVAVFDPSDPQDLDVVLVRKDCNGLSEACHTKFYEVLNWIRSTRRPTAANPLLVDIGPGTFCPNDNCVSATTGINCDLDADNEADMGHFTLRGAGPDRTVIGGSLGIWFQSCDGVDMRDLTVWGSKTHGVLWTETGDSRWTNVVMRGAQAGWYDHCWPTQTHQAGQEIPTPRSVHYIFSSRIEGTYAYVALCADNWIYASEIVGDARTGGDRAVGIDVTGTGQLRLFGSNVRALGGSEIQLLAGVRVDLFGGNDFDETPGREQFHMHGGLIEVDAGSSGLDAVGIEAGSHAAAPEGQVENLGAMVHVLGTAYQLKPNGGAAVRLQVVPETGSDVHKPHFHAPFRWPPGTEPPFPGLASLDGADVFVETDCGSDGLCDGGAGDDESHVMLYNPARCPTELWFDSTAGHCRNAPPAP